MELGKGYKWGSCGRDLSWSASKHRHIVPIGGLDTICGNSATDSSIWRDNKKKPNCLVCIEVFEKSR